MNQDGIMSLWFIASPFNNPWTWMTVISMLYCAYSLRGKIKNRLTRRKVLLRRQDELAAEWQKMVMHLRVESLENWSNICAVLFETDQSPENRHARRHVNSLQWDYMLYYWQHATRGVAIQYQEAKLRYRYPRLTDAEVDARVFDYFVEYEASLNKDRVLLSRCGIPLEYLHVPFEKTTASVNLPACLSGRP